MSWRSPRSTMHWWYGEWRIEPRRRTLEREMTEAWGRPITLERYGSGRRDSVYLARGAGAPVAVVRLLNPYKGRVPAAPMLRRLGIVTRDRNDRLRGTLDAEWDWYTRLADSGVTPAPLWRTDDATAVAYLPGERLHRLLARRPSNADAWNWIELALGALARVHGHGLAHRDANVTNFLIDTEIGRAYVIDFLPRKGGAADPAIAQAYDYLRFLDSVLQHAPALARGATAQWVRLLEPIVPTCARRCDLAPLLAKRRELRHLRHCAELRAGLGAIFTGLTASTTPS